MKESTIPKIYYDEQALKEDAAAIYLGYARRTLSKWRLANIGPPYIKITKNSIRYRFCDLQDWLNKRRIITTEGNLDG